MPKGRGLPASVDIVLQLTKPYQDLVLQLIKPYHGVVLQPVRRHRTYVFEVNAVKSPVQCSMY